MLESVRELISRVNPDDYNYDLPNDRIASRPTAERTESRLLVCSIPSGRISHTTFQNLASILPSNATLVVNNTKVIRARIELFRESGGRIECLLLEPHGPIADPALSLAGTESGIWTCMIGGLKKFRNAGVARTGFTYINERGKECDGTLSAELVHTGEPSRANGNRETAVKFSWDPSDLSFAQILESAGHIPLPPYLHRHDSPRDAIDYQTVYSRHEGAVAAPTAGLHFSDVLLEQLADNGVETVNVTLHVGAGTFAPMKTEPSAHSMHSEQIRMSASDIERIRDRILVRESEAAPFVVVGTTSSRTLESLYWIGLRAVVGESIADANGLVHLPQWEGLSRQLELKNLTAPSIVFTAILDWMKKTGRDEFAATTELMIVPGYQFQICDALITNFHQPDSTLLMLVGAFLGRDLLQNVYRMALDFGYRFLSYGDSSILIRRPELFPSLVAESGPI